MTILFFLLALTIALVVWQLRPMRVELPYYEREKHHRNSTPNLPLM